MFYFIHILTKKFYKDLKFDLKIMDDKSRRRSFSIRRYKTRINSIYRLTFALKRDIDRIVGENNTTHHQNTDQNINVKLDLIANTLLEMRDKLEKSFNNQRVNSIQMNPNPNTQVLTTNNAIPNYNYNSG